LGARTGPAKTYEPLHLASDIWVTIQRFGEKGAAASSLKEDDKRPALASCRFHEEYYGLLP
jgi:hypothetical protein